MPDHVGGARAQRDPDADLARTRCHREGDDGAESEDVAGREEGVVAVDDDSGGDEDDDDDDNDEKEADRSGLLSTAAGDGAGDPGDGV